MMHSVFSMQYLIFPMTNMKFSTTRPFRCLHPLAVPLSFKSFLNYHCSTAINLALAPIIAIFACSPSRLVADTTNDSPGRGMIEDTVMLPVAVGAQLHYQIYSFDVCGFFVLTRT